MLGTAPDAVVFPIGAMHHVVGERERWRLRCPSKDARDDLLRALRALVAPAA